MGQGSFKGQGSRVRFIRLAAALTIGAVALSLTGCSGFFTAIGTGGTVGNGTSTFAYVANAGGTLAEVFAHQRSPCRAQRQPHHSLPLAPTSIVVAPNNAFVYIGTGTGVFLYTINSDGTLTEGNGDNVAYVNATNQALIATSMVIDPTSSWLLIAYQSSEILDAVQLTPTTGLPTGAVFSINSSASTPNPQLAISPANKQVFVALGAGKTEELAFSPSVTTAPDGPWPSSGTLIPFATASATADTSVAVDPTSTYLYIAEQNANSTSATAGTVRIIATANLAKDLDDEPTGVGPTAVLSDLTGAYVYVANGTDGNISGFTLDTTTQKLTSLGTAFPRRAVAHRARRGQLQRAICTLSATKPTPTSGFTALTLSSSAGSLDVSSSTKSTGSTNPSASTGIALTH